MDIALQEVSLAVQGRPILDRATATIQGGALTCLLGANGAGKTTLLRILSGELKPTSGRILRGEDDLSSRPQKEIARHFAIVPQGVGDPPHLTVRELVSLSRFRPARNLWWSLSPQDKEAVAGYIHRCQLERLADRPVAQLSGGERQRAWLAFSLAQEKEFLLLDEALDALDFVARRSFFRLLGDVVAGERGVLLTTHDLGLATEFATRIVILNAGRVAYEGPPTADLHKLIGSTVTV
ncbi:MAG: ABC transporter ATP-binding protein [Chloroflexota bacterium]|nr:ABC transporter ATP-binding protein [Chloroflexota bacterium]